MREADKTYTLGMGVAELATGLVGLSHAELIRPELERLALNYDMLLVLWRVTEDSHVVLIDRAYTHTAVRVEMRLRPAAAIAGRRGRALRRGGATPPRGPNSAGVSRHCAGRRRRASRATAQT